MHKLEFAADLTPNGEGGFIVSFADVPEALNEGADRAQALADARDALAVALLGRILDGEPLPKPAPARGRALVAPPARRRRQDRSYHSLARIRDHQV